MSATPIGLGWTPAATRPRHVGHVDHEQRTDLVGDRTEGVEVDDPRVRRGARHDQPGPQLAGHLGDLDHVDAAVLAAYPVVVKLVQAPREVDLEPVREVPAVGKIHRQHRVAGL